MEKEDIAKEQSTDAGQTQEKAEAMKEEKTTDEAKEPEVKTLEPLKPKDTTETHPTGPGTSLLVAELVTMGFPEDLSRRAAEQTNDLEEAANLILIIQENHEGKITAPTKDKVKELTYKMVIVVRNDLKMKPGKIAAQVGHGVLAAYKLALKKTPDNVIMWEDIGQMKVVVQCNSEKELLDVYNQALKLDLPAEYIQDAGRTQVEPGSITVCAIGPARSDQLDKVTGNLRLY